jgi:hypothetical protein
MSLDVYLTTPGEIHRYEARIFVREDGQTKELTREEWDAKYPGQSPVTTEIGDTNEVFENNITHNLNKMADAAGIYKECWHPGELGITKARQLIEPLAAGLEKLRADPSHFKAFNPSNGWGNYEGLCRFVSEYLDACKAYPDADVRACA